MSADPFAALEACVAGYSKLIKDLGGCDHSVGICMCNEIEHTRKATQAIGQLRAELARAKSATPANPSRELFDKLGDDMRYE